MDTICVALGPLQSRLDPVEVTLIVGQEGVAPLWVQLDHTAAASARAIAS
jgi:hypothetical protein